MDTKIKAEGAAIFAFYKQIIKDYQLAPFSDSDFEKVEENFWAFVKERKGTLTAKERTFAGLENLFRGKEINLKEGWLEIEFNKFKNPPKLDTSLLSETALSNIKKAAIAFVMPPDWSIQGTPQHTKLLESLEKTYNDPKKGYNHMTRNRLILPASLLTETEKTHAYALGYGKRFDGLLFSDANWGDYVKMAKEVKGLTKPVAHEYTEAEMAFFNLQKDDKFNIGQQNFTVLASTPKTVKFQKEFTLKGTPKTEVFSIGAGSSKYGGLLRDIESQLFIDKGDRIQERRYSFASDPRTDWNLLTILERNQDYNKPIETESEEKAEVKPNRNFKWVLNTSPLTNFALYHLLDDKDNVIGTGAEKSTIFKKSNVDVRVDFDVKNDLPTIQLKKDGSISLYTGDESIPSVPKHQDIDSHDYKQGQIWTFGENAFYFIKYVQGKGGTYNVRQVEEGKEPLDTLDMTTENFSNEMSKSTLVGELQVGYVYKDVSESIKIKNIDYDGAGTVTYRRMRVSGNYEKTDSIMNLSESLFKKTLVLRSDGSQSRPDNFEKGQIYFSLAATPGFFEITTIYRVDESTFDYYYENNYRTKPGEKDFFVGGMQRNRSIQFSPVGKLGDKYLTTIEKGQRFILGLGDSEETLEITSINFGKDLLKYKIIKGGKESDEKQMPFHEFTRNFIYANFKLPKKEDNPEPKTKIPPPSMEDLEKIAEKELEAPSVFEAELKVGDLVLVEGLSVTYSVEAINGDKITVASGLNRIDTTVLLSRILWILKPKQPRKDEKLTDRYTVGEIVAVRGYESLYKIDAIGEDSMTVSSTQLNEYNKPLTGPQTKMTVSDNQIQRKYIKVSTPSPSNRDGSVSPIAHQASTMPSDEQERLIRSFEEINEFYAKKNMLPQMSSSITEYQLYTRLKALREDDEKMEILKPYDKYEILAIHEPRFKIGDTFEMWDDERKEVHTIIDINFDRQIRNTKYKLDGYEQYREGAGELWENQIEQYLHEKSWRLLKKEDSTPSVSEPKKVKIDYWWTLNPVEEHDDKNREGSPLGKFYELKSGGGYFYTLSEKFTQKNVFKGISIGLSKTYRDATYGAAEIKRVYIEDIPKGYIETAKKDTLILFNSFEKKPTPSVSTPKIEQDYGWNENNAATKPLKVVIYEKKRDHLIIRLAQDAMGKWHVGQSINFGTEGESSAPGLTGKSFDTKEEALLDELTKYANYDGDYPFKVEKAKHAKAYLKTLSTPEIEPKTEVETPSVFIPDANRKFIWNEHGACTNAIKITIYEKGYNYIVVSLAKTVNGDWCSSAYINMFDRGRGDGGGCGKRDTFYKTKEEAFYATLGRMVNFFNEEDEFDKHVSKHAKAYLAKIMKLEIQKIKIELQND